ncbi:MAG: NADH-quinone oxidoreductase subunit L [Alphaproteobacteria bacterium]
MIALIVFLPLIGSIIVGLLTKKLNARNAQLITSILVSISAIISFIVFYKVIFLKNIYYIELLKWIDVGSFNVTWGLKVDPLTAVMLVVITSISSLVHIYSIGYMSHDPHIQRFMAYLSLFTFSMLMLVTSNNFIQLFFGWEGVGLCSYLLIGFWYKTPEANKAAMKAFLVNRVGDIAFALGIFTIFLNFDSVNFESVFTSLNQYENLSINLFGYELPLLNTIGILLFIGAMGKSAQIGLHTWLPDAMEGPTPVSALIHAATMVTAGVFLVARCSPIFEYAQVAKNMVTIIGAVTCIFAATIAITQNDIKKIIAYSTCSQLGYMFFACGVSAYSAGIFHLMTHAFFKALLFLAAGSVIHAMSGEQDIRKMGGLSKKIPLTYATIWIGSLALAGIWPFAGYFSKDIILEAVYAADSKYSNFAYICGLFAAFLTAFYSWRLIILVFNREKRYSNELDHQVHEAPNIMLIPLYILSFGAVTAGILGVKFGMVSAEQSFWQGVIAGAKEDNIYEKAHHVSSIVKLSPTIAGILGIMTSYIFYYYLPNIPKIISEKCRPIYLLLKNKYYFDELYNLVFVQTTVKIGQFLWQVFDIRVIDGIGPNGSAKLSNYLSKILSRLQSGYLYHYAFLMILGFVCIINWYILRNSY